MERFGDEIQYDHKESSDHLCDEPSILWISRSESRNGWLEINRESILHRDCCNDSCDELAYHSEYGCPEWYSFRECAVEEKDRISAASVHCKRDGHEYRSCSDGCEFDRRSSIRLDSGIDEHIEICSDSFIPTQSDMSSIAPPSPSTLRTLLFGHSGRNHRRICRARHSHALLLLLLWHEKTTTSTTLWIIHALLIHRVNLLFFFGVCNTRFFR